VLGDYKHSHTIKLHISIGIESSIIDSNLPEITNTSHTALFLLTVSTSGFVPTIVSAQPATESEQNSATFKFSCGQAADPSSKKNLPATVATVSGNPESAVLIVWKSEYFGGKYTPQQRCGIVSKAIDKAFHEGRTYIGSGTDKASGLGVVCAVANPEQLCDRTNMLFTLKSYQSAGDTIEQLGQVVQGKSGQPLYQSSGGKRVNLRDLSSKLPIR
jgi:hypothetical protein